MIRPKQFANLHTVIERDRVCKICGLTKPAVQFRKISECRHSRTCLDCEAYYQELLKWEAINTGKGEYVNE